VRNLRRALRRNHGQAVETSYGVSGVVPDRVTYFVDYGILLFCDSSELLSRWCCLIPLTGRVAKGFQVDQ
jgi:hypothetical protein